MNQRQTGNGVNKFEALDAEGGDIAALLSALPRAEAPGNFEFGVKARIAKGQTPRRTSFPLLKVAAPLVLLFVLASFLLYGSRRGVDAPAVVENQPVRDATAPMAATTQASIPEVSLAPVQTQLEIEGVRSAQRIPVASRDVKGTRPSRASQGGSVDRPMNGGSVDQALGTANTILPRGFQSPRSANSNVNVNVGGTRTPVREVFEMLGISAEFGSGSWKVRSVAASSVASHAGIQAGDIIEAVDGQELKSDFLPKGGAATITVRREGKTINLNLKN